MTTLFQKAKKKSNEAQKEALKDEMELDRQMKLKLEERRLLRLKGIDYG